jgi:hypothetical protein
MGQMLTWIWTRRLWLLGPLLVMATGCFQYDLALHFDHQHRGQMVQTITLTERGAAVARATLEPWLADLQTRVGPLGGKLTRPGPEQVVISLPFTTAADLVERFDALLADAGEVEEGAWPVLTLPRLGQVPFHLEVEQRNWGVVSYTHLTCDLDLTALPSQLVDAGEPSGFQPQTRDGLRFHLQTPWGLKQIASTSDPPAEVVAGDTIWRLPPGTTHHLEASFWLPNAVGLSAAAISGLVLIGYFVRYRLLR